MEDLRKRFKADGFVDLYAALLNIDRWYHIYVPPSGIAIGY